MLFRAFLFAPAFVMLSGSAWAGASPAPPACGPDALGTSRIMTIGNQGPSDLGLKTYHETLGLGDHEVVLTFDDGPSRRTTPAVLAALAAQCVRATFFLIGRNALAAPNLVKREVAAGHNVGSHSFSHPEITLRGLAEPAAEADIEKGFRAVNTAGFGIDDATPRVPFFRYPGFADTEALDAWLASRHVTVFGADLWASDWIKMTPEQELALMMDRLTKAGRGIILLHDIKPQTAAMLPAFLKRLKTDGFHIVHMVPGDGRTPVTEAPPNWHSETDTSIAALWPHLVRLGALSPMPR
ncbi:polysaccharide deacetylase family protein [Lichenihabitans sp. Uapishka_5]|uniref:polysaccharide deacetylase family protein n=1 Tax=Lichenihabitans sp. Uapishka_5 TaxID=3037302 RepID=UPI0029E801EE|nr:polysaccharide deacetylase family protein [Lichenihabitans sp. Uapishka_5]MDX7950165.1 polysaccharide deacetylase family protein [Lichenihabitans sp. Uapishka_5]